jgi:hypothetical protein
MMRPLRVSVIATLSLLAWTATASAESAWIWWGMTGESADVIGGYTTKQECEQALSVLEAQLKLTSAKVGRALEGNRLMITFPHGGKDVTTVHSCLPDTVDPRGPKGK